MQAFVGLEIHVQLRTRTKIFCSCKNSFGNEQNTNICPVCMGYPGTLPVLNNAAVLKSYIVACALSCELAPSVCMERKNYFYPDLPRNYQISQFAQPIGRTGSFTIISRKHSVPEKQNIRIREVHLEEDAGKLLHIGDNTLCDYNRAGTPLLEIVTEPDIHNGRDAEILLRLFQRFVRYLEVSDGDMEKGSMRCDANVSVSRDGTLPGYRVEIKNLNSPRFIRKALEYEIERQQNLLVSGGEISSHTRLWNENRDKTEELRVKESSQDYRYFPEPDIPPFFPDKKFFQTVQEAMIELPQARKERIMKDYNLAEDTADLLCSDKYSADFFERLLESGIEAKLAANWMTVDIRQQYKYHNCQNPEESVLSFERTLELLRMLQEGQIHGKLAKQVLALIFTEDKDPKQIMQEQGWESLSDGGQLLTLVQGVLREEQDMYREQEKQTDEKKRFSYLMGRIMKTSKGSADPRIVSEILRKELEEQEKK